MIALLVDGARAAAMHAATSVPAPGPDFNEDTVTPGLFGFVTMLVIAVAVVLLAVDMVRRVRRTTYRAQVTERLDAEEAQRAEEQRAEEQGRTQPPL